MGKRPAAVLTSPILSFRQFVRHKSKRAVFIEFDDKVIHAFPDHDIHIVELYELQHGQEEEDSVQAVVAGLEYLFEGKYFFASDEAQHKVTAALHCIVVLDDRMNGFILPLLDTQHDPFEAFHQLEHSDSLDLGAFAGFFPDQGKLFLEIATFDHQHPDGFHFDQGNRCLFIPFVLQQFLDQFLPGVDLISLFIQFLSGQEHFCLDTHECGDKKDELAGQFDIEAFLGVDIGQKILYDPGNGNIVDIQFIPLDKEQQQVEGALELGQFDLVVWSAHSQRKYRKFRLPRKPVFPKPEGCFPQIFLFFAGCFWAWTPRIANPEAQVWLAGRFRG